MEFADLLDKEGYTQLAKDCRKIVWDEAERRWKAQ